MGDALLRLAQKVHVRGHVREADGKLIHVGGYTRMFHLSARANRASIEQHGLDWRRFAGNRSLDYERGNYLWATEEAAREDQEYDPTADLYAVDVSAATLKPDPEQLAEIQSGAFEGEPTSYLATKPIPAKRLRRIV